jgi:8-oxo-dGTP pyrophosphatase MutT (NUDIX family)
MEGWHRGSIEVLYSHFLFELQRRRLERAGESRDVLVLHSADWVQVVPVLPDGRILLIRQWRYGSESFHLEFPGGLVDPGETPRRAAERELLEETGYRAAGWHLLGELDPNPAILDNRLHIFAAEGLERVGEIAGDEDEEIELVPVAAAEVPELFRRGEMRHGLMLAAWALFELREERA